jgi:hypothetical protein
LREESGELKLGKAIARIMKGEKFNNEWIDTMFEIKDEKNSSLRRMTNTRSCLNYLNTFYTTL